MLEKATRWISRAVRESLLLGRAEQVAADLSPQHDQIRRLFDAAERRRRAAELLTDEDQLSTSISIQLEAAKLMTATIVVSHGGSIDANALRFSELCDSLASLAQSGTVPALPPELDKIKDLAGAASPLDMDAWSAEEATALRGMLDRVNRWCRDRIEPRSVGEIRAQRWLRLGLMAAIMVALVAFGIHRALAPKNLALKKPVAMSSRAPNQPPGSGPNGADPSGLVDGRHGPTFDVATRYELQAWVSVDLKKPYPLTKVILYGRGDCCWESSVPAVLEVSLDGKTYKEIAQRTAVFSETNPWEADLARVPARFVRVRLVRTGNLVLNELEVYGR
jgi:F5/8 type C domain